ncbi:MAG: LysR family transcriptional regulator [Pseudomonadota bacterium]
MRFKKLNLNLIVVLDALLAENSVTKAGQRLHVSQTTISDALARLREYFNDELLTQVGRKMVPTPLGATLVQPVRDMLLQADIILNTQPTFDPAAAERKFTFMISDYVSTVLMMKVIPLVSQLAPKVTIEMMQQSRMPSESLDRGDIDFLIIPETFLAASSPSQHLFTDDFCCVAWTGNPLIGERIDEKQFLQLGHVVVKLGETRQPSIEEWFFKTLRGNRRVETVTMDFNSAPQAVVGTNRLAVMHTKLARHYAAFLPIRLVPVTFALPVLNEHIQWNRYSAHDPAIIWMRDLLVSMARVELQTP